MRILEHFEVLSGHTLSGYWVEWAIDLGIFMCWLPFLGAPPPNPPRLTLVATRHIKTLSHFVLQGTVLCDWFT